MRPLFRKDINKKFSPTWILCNDNSKSKTYRSIFLERFGGRFDKQGLYYIWKSKAKTIPPAPKVRIVKMLNRAGEVVVVENVKKYCKDNKMSRGAFGEVLSGKRKSYKGYRLLPEDHLSHDSGTKNSENKVVADSDTEISNNPIENQPIDEKI
jgi:hypothetical protein